MNKTVGKGRYEIIKAILAFCRHSLISFLLKGKGQFSVGGVFVKKLLKESVSVLLAVVLIFGAVQLSGTSLIPKAAAGYVDGNYTYAIANGEATITDVEDSISGDITIPTTLGGCPVTCIGDNSFDFCRNLKSLKIPDSVTRIGKLAFNKCNNLTSIALSDSLTEISNYAFSKCVGLMSIEIPSSVKSIGKEVFYECGSLTGIKVDKNNAYYSNDEYGALFNKSKTELIQYPAGNLRTSYAVPTGVTDINNWAFYVSKYLKTVELPNSITSIGDATFRFCTSLTSINIPRGVKNIGFCTFEKCQSLTSIKIPDGVTSIDEAAFRFCESLKSVELPKSVSNISGDAFSGCDSLTDVYYSGSKTDWSKINIDKNNDTLINANIHYNWQNSSNQSVLKSDATVNEKSSSTIPTSVIAKVEGTDNTSALNSVAVIADESKALEGAGVENEKRDNKTIIIVSSVVAVAVIAAVAAIVVYKKKRANKEESSK